MVRPNKTVYTLMNMSYSNNTIVHLSSRQVAILARKKTASRHFCFHRHRYNVFIVDNEQVFTCWVIFVIVMDFEWYFTQLFSLRDISLVLSTSYGGALRTQSNILDKAFCESILEKSSILDALLGLE